MAAKWHLACAGVSGHRRARHLRGRRELVADLAACAKKAA